jgi:flagellum-specific peptidoglycan hydrolase FlgJ
MAEQEQYQSYAQNGRFNPVEQVSYIAGTQRNIERLQAAETAHWEGRRANDRANEQSAKMLGRDLESLAQFSTKLSDHLVEERKKKNEAEQDEGLNQAYMGGITPEQQAKFDEEESALRQSDDALQTQLDKVEKTGAPQDAVTKLRGLSGWKAYGYAMGLAQMAGQDYGTWLSQAMGSLDKQITVGDKTFSPGEAESPEEHAAAVAQLRLDFMKERGINNLNPALLNKYTWEQMRRSESIYMEGVREKHQKAQDETAKNEALNVLGTNIITDPGAFETSVKALIRATRDPKEARKLAMDYLFSLVAAGKADPTLIETVENTVFSVTGKTWGESFSSEWLEAKNRALKERQALFQLQEAEVSMDQKQTLDGIMSDLQSGKKYTDEDIDQIITLWQEKYGTTDVPKELTDYKNNHTLQARDKQEQKDQLDRLLASQQLTSAELRSGKYSDELIIEYDAKARQIDQLHKGGEVAKAGQYQIKAIEDAVKGQIEAFDDNGRMHPSVHLAIGAGVAEMEKQAKALKMGNPAMSWEDAYNQASMNVSQAISAGQGRWAMNGEIGPAAAFPAFATGRVAGQNVQAAQQRISLWKSTITSGGVAALEQNLNNLFSQDELKSLANPEIKDSAALQKVAMMAAWLNQTGKPITIDQAIESALKSSGLTRERPFKQDPYEKAGLSANMMRLLTAPTPARLSRVSAQGNLPPATIRTGPQGAQDIIQAAISFGFPAHIAPLAAAQWAIESGWGQAKSGRNNVFGIKGAGTTVSTQEDYGNGLQTVQASFRDYSSQLESVKDYVDLLTKEPRYAAVLQARTPAEAVRAVKAAGYATDPNYVAKTLGTFRAMGINPNQPFDYTPRTASPWSNPSLMGPAAKQFITGGTGVGSGPHLHMGVFDPQQGSYINPTGYENYITVGGVPIAKKYTVTSGYGPRNTGIPGASTNHRGVDYGIPEGTKLSVRGGRYMRTWWDEGGGGYVSSYRLTDGRELRLMHGHQDNVKT